MNPDTCFACQNRHRSEWCSLDGEELALLNQAKTRNDYDEGQVIFYQGNPCFGVHCVERGTIALRRDDAKGNSVIVRLHHPGSTLGYSSFFSGQSYGGTATALTESRVCFIEKTTLRELIERNPSVGHRFLATLARGLDEADEEKLQAATHALRSRLAHLLLVLKDRFGAVDAVGQLIIDLPLSRKDIGALLGGRPESISRAIRQLEEDDIARFEKRRVVVPDLDSLFDEVERT